MARVQVKKNGSKILKSTIFELHKPYTPQKKVENNHHLDLIQIFFFNDKVEKIVSYQLNYTANSADSTQKLGKWAGLAVQFSW